MRKFLVILSFIIPLFSLAQVSMIQLESKPVREPKQRDTVVDNWNSAQPGFKKLPQQAKQLLYWTNYCRNNPTKFLDSAVAPILADFPNLNRSEAKSLRQDLLSTGPLPMFSLNEILVRTAQMHASDIGHHKGPLGHNSTDGTDFGTRMKRAGIKYCANENISLSSQSVLLSVVLLYLDINLPGLGHRKALLDKNLSEIGVGSALYDVDQYFLVQDMACRQQ